ncbi:ABC transporter ATP-binding protein [Streptomyces pratensis]|uniref:ABC transporter ATP-binding protein n=1 Tax=Streptomyces pratensis TaxID=1169025 RepID=UPI00301AB99C
MIRAEELTVRFGETTVLDRVTLRVAEGEAVLLAGPNGAGKSTLLRVIAGLTPAAAGTCRVAGEPPDSAAAGALRGFVQDEPPLYEYLTVREHLAFAARLWGVSAADAPRGLERFGAAGWADTLIRDLSLGTRKKVGLVAALLHRPRLVLLDEPFNGLDAASCTELVALLGEVRSEGRTVLLTSHEPQRLEPLLDRTITLGPPAGPPTGGAAPLVAPHEPGDERPQEDT